MVAYEEAIRATAAPHAPWFVIPADHKWFTRLAVAGEINLGATRPRPALPDGVAGDEGTAGGGAAAAGERVRARPELQFGDGFGEPKRM